MRIAIESNLDSRAGSSLPQAEQFQIHTPPPGGIERSDQNTHVAKTGFGLPRQMTHDQPQRSAPRGGQLPTPKQTFVDVVKPRQNRTDSRSAQCLIAGPRSLVDMIATHQQ